MRGFSGIRKARKDRQCSEHSYHRIAAGDLYLVAELPPEHDMNGSRRSDPGGKRWQRIGACIRCAKEYGLLNSDTRKKTGFQVTKTTALILGLLAVYLLGLTLACWYPRRKR